MWVAVHTVVVSAMGTREVRSALASAVIILLLVAHFRVLVVEEAVSSVAASVKAGLRLLCCYDCVIVDKVIYIVPSRYLRTYSLAPQSTLKG